MYILYNKTDKMSRVTCITRFCVFVVITAIEVNICVGLSVLIAVVCGCICMQFVVTQMSGQ